MVPSCCNPCNVGNHCPIVPSCKVFKPCNVCNYCPIVPSSARYATLVRFATPAKITTIAPSCKVGNPCNACNFSKIALSSPLKSMQPLQYMQPLPYRPLLQGLQPLPFPLSFLSRKVCKPIHLSCKVALPPLLKGGQSYMYVDNLASQKSSRCKKSLEMCPLFCNRNTELPSPRL